jgi:hypothetical protein
MSEDRFPGDLSNGSSSSLKLGLKVAGIALGMAVLLCGGVAAYVAMQDDGSQANATKVPPATPMMKPEAMRAIAAKIVEIDIPADFEPISANESSYGLEATFGRRNTDGAFLKLRRMFPSTMPRGADPRSAGEMVLHVADRGDELTDTTLTGMPEPESTRELTVLGNLEKFKFFRGKRSSGEKTVRKVAGSFMIPAGLIVLIYTIPEEEYDEEAVVRMIESIRLAERKSAGQTETSPSPPFGQTKASDAAPTADTKESHVPPTDEVNDRNGDASPSDDEESNAG